MRKQRSIARGCSRRRFLRAVGAGGIAGLAGCTGGASAGAATGGSGGESATVAILAAGSLQHALEQGFEPAVDVPVRIEAHGSATVARMVAEGQRDPDVVTVADTALFDGPLDPPWYAAFASNALVLAYNPETEGGRRLAEAGTERWYEPLVEGSVSLGRTDPDRDPLGYRTLFAFELASRYYDGASDLRARIPTREQVYPETGLISRFETGAVDAAVAYRNMAEERGYEYVELPDRIDLSDPEYAEDWYSTVSYELPSGREVRGGVVSYASTIRKPSDAARSAFAVHATGDYLEESGLLLREEFPRYEGEVPDEVRAATGGSDGGRSARRSPDRALGESISDVRVLV